jgi:hypothetical protein
MRYTAPILFVLALTSCELVTTVDLPEQPRVAVVNSMFTSDTTWFISVSTTRDILSDFNFWTGDVEVFLNDETGVQIPLTHYNPWDSGAPIVLGDVGAGSFFRGSTKPVPGMTYSLEVRASEIPTAYATARCPVMVGIIDLKIDSANMIEGSGEASFNYRALPIEFTFDDPAGEEDYYYPRMFAFYEYLSIRNGDTTRGVTPSYIPLVKELPGSDLFGAQREVDAMNDKTFDGTRKTERLYIIDYNYTHDGPEPVAVKFYLHHANQDYFKYTRSMELAQRARENPFAEPVQVYSNIDGGLGIFAGATTATWKLK